MNVKRFRMGCGCGVAEDGNGKYVEWKDFTQLEREHEQLKALCKEIETDYKTVFAQYRRLLVMCQAPSDPFPYVASRENEAQRGVE